MGKVLLAVVVLALSLIPFGEQHGDPDADVIHQTWQFVGSCCLAGSIILGTTIIMLAQRRKDRNK